MPTDLTTAPDHPAAVLDRHTGFARPDHNTPDNYAEWLRQYERERGVTFAALDNDALAAVRDAYTTNDRAALRSAIADLLGLGD